MFRTCQHGMGFANSAWVLWRCTWYGVVFESPVQSGFLDLRRGNCEPDWSIHFSNLGQPATEPTTTGPHQMGCLQKTGCNQSFGQSLNPRVRVTWLVAQDRFHWVFLPVSDHGKNSQVRLPWLAGFSCDNPYKMHRRSEMLCLCVHHRGSPRVRVTWLVAQDRFCGVFCPVNDHGENPWVRLPWLTGVSHDHP
jgi:hypothetical protein